MAQLTDDEGHRQWVEAERRSARLLARSGRIPTGGNRVLYDAGEATMARRAFEAQTRKVGTVYRLDDGRRGLLVERTVWFIAGEDLELGAHIAYPDEPHWCCKYVYALVEATDDERWADIDPDPGRVATVQALIDAGDRTRTPR